LLVKGMFCAFTVKMIDDFSTSMRELDGHSLIFFYFSVQALAPRLLSSKAALQLSANITLFFVLSYLQVSSPKRATRTPMVWGYHFYTNYRG
jgi:hypothetical protein